MSRVIVDMSPSVDGYVAGRGVSVEQPFGDAGLRLYRWLGFDGAEQTRADVEAGEAQLAGSGAVVLGRTMFEVGIGPWGETGAFERPCFVATSREHEPVIKGPTTFNFVTDGVTRAVELAIETAAGQDVVVVGGANVVQQCLAAGLVDEIRLHVAPVMLGGGVSLFGEEIGQRIELEPSNAVVTPLAVHLMFHVRDLT
jgi:dihydrofolate reductase